MGKLAFLFPGQGAQHVGMARDFHDAFPASRSVYARACDVLGWDVAARCFEGPASELGRTAVSQPAIFVTSLAVLAAMEEKGFPQVKDATAAAGLSLGEYTALVFAGALEFECALQIVQKRGELMEAACEAQGGAMVSLIGLGEADAEPYAGTPHRDRSCARQTSTARSRPFSLVRSRLSSAPRSWRSSAARNAPFGSR